MSYAPAVRGSILTLAVCYFALWACAPINQGPPPVAMVDGRNHEVGLAASYLQLAPDANGTFGSCLGAASGTLACSGPSLAAWYRYDKGRFDLTAQAFGGVPNLFGVTGRIAYRVVDTDRVFFAPGLQAGFLTAGVSLPVGYAVSPHWWLVVTPSGQLAFTSLLHGSVGGFYNSSGGLTFGAELGGGTTFNANVPFQLDASVLIGYQFP